MTVLVYGEWKNQSENIKSFFTASFKNTDKVNFKPRNYNKALKFIFTGSLVKGKRPDLAIKLIEALRKHNIEAHLDLYGDGILKAILEEYVKKYNLGRYISFKGSQPLHIIKSALQEAHFSILASKSEGWPKAVAEAMFYGVIPIATPVSCVADMLGNGKRGLLISSELNTAVKQVIEKIKTSDLNTMSRLAQDWSQGYTLDAFEEAIKELIS
jgi:glycosyltransferase involved in cell wall biosynthesis